MLSNSIRFLVSQEGEAALGEVDLGGIFAF